MLRDGSVFLPSGHFIKGEIHMSKIAPRTLSGFMELLPDQEQQMQRIQEVLRKTYALYGFTPLDTPVIESADVLLAKGGGETEKQIYRFQKGDSDLALRFDLTVPLAKYVALHYNDLSFPFRRYQIGKVYRGERAQRGRFREFYQADIDIIGDGKLSILNEAEIPSIIYRTFSELGLKRFQIRVNNRKILTGFYAMLGLSEKSGDIMRTVDKLDKIGPDKVKTILTDDFAVSSADADEILKFISISGGTDAVLSALEGYRGKNETFDEGLSELNTVVRYLGAFGVPAENFVVDLTIARGLDYYTGTVYETTLLDHPEIGSICSGGRYDNLAGFYTDRELPGVGISIGLTRLFYVLGEQNMLNPALPTAPADVLILPMTEDLAPAIQLSTRLREVGIRTQLHCEDKKFKQKLTYANKLNIPYVVMLGEDELAAGVVTCKDMISGEQTKLSPEETISRIQTGLAERSKGAVILG
jgi:histidyl-tRNA synthetase